METCLSQFWRGFCAFLVQGFFPEQEDRHKTIRVSREGVSAGPTTSSSQCCLVLGDPAAILHLTLGKNWTWVFSPFCETQCNISTWNEFQLQCHIVWGQGIILKKSNHSIRILPSSALVTEKYHLSLCQETQSVLRWGSTIKIPQSNSVKTLSLR